MYDKIKFNKVINNIFLAIFAAVLFIGSLENVQASDGRAPIEDIGVVVDNKDLKNTKSLYTVQNTIMISLDDFCKEIGAEFSWVEYGKSFIAKDDNTQLYAIIGNNETVLNGNKILVSVAPTIIENTAYAPLYFLANSFEYQVIKNNSEHKIYLKKIKKDKNEALKNYTSSDYFSEDYVNLKVVDNKYIVVEGKTSLSKEKYLIRVDKFGKKYNSKPNKDKVVLRSVGDIINKKYNDTIDLSGKLTNGRYSLMVFFDKKKVGNALRFETYYTNIRFTYKDGEITFAPSAKYDSNLRQYANNSKKDPKLFLGLNEYTVAEQERIRKLAQEIVAGASTDYEKVKRIHDWMANNIYYDWDSYLSGKYGYEDAIDTLNSKKSVCSGYSKLTLALTRSLNIPSKLVLGYALGISGASSWEEADDSKANHAWNEVYVDGRWIILDTTWDSLNKFEGGKYKKANKISHVYFDPSMRAFSNTHKIIEIYK